MSKKSRLYIPMWLKIVYILYLNKNHSLKCSAITMYLESHYTNVHNLLKDIIDNGYIIKIGYYYNLTELGLSLGREISKNIKNLEVI
jgi:predicted transcriptional regulator